MLALQDAGWRRRPGGVAGEFCGRANEPREAPVAAPAQPATPQAALPEHRADIPANKPLRFVWLVDPEQNFFIEGDDFIRLIGPQTAALLGKPWAQIAETLGSIRRAAWPLR